MNSNSKYNNKEKQQNQYQNEEEYMTQNEMISKFNILSQLGQGQSCEVYLAQDITTGNKIALKVINGQYLCSEDEEQVFDAEVNALKSIKPHQNIIGFIESGKAMHQWQDGTKSLSRYVALQYSKDGEIFDLITNSNGLTEQLARYYFKQILSGVQNIHFSGFSHRDLKLQNILLDSNQQQVKLVDFGFAIPLGGQHGNEALSGKIGTPMFMAPEIHFGQLYNGKLVDIFALGVVLFSMVLNQFPFAVAKPGDQMFTLIALGQTDKFWKFFEDLRMELGQAEMTDDFKDLVVKLLSVNPQDRPQSIEDILQHSWMQQM